MWETPFSAHLRRSSPDDRRCRGPKGRGSRCEAARAASRFGGQVREDVLKCTIAPGFGREGDPSSPSFSPCLSSPPLLLPFLPFSARGPGSQGGRRFVTMAHNRLLLYSAFDDDQPLPIYRYRKWRTAGDCTPVGHRCTSLHSGAETPYGSSPCVRPACHPTTCPRTAQRFSTLSLYCA